MAPGTTAAAARHRRAEPAPAIGSVDGVYDERICGWAVGRTDPAASSPLELEFSGGIIRRVLTDYCRADIATLGHPGENLAGFAFPLADLTSTEVAAILAAADGEDIVCSVRAAGLALDHSPCRLSRRQLIAAVLKRAPETSIMGALDAITPAGVRGWCVVEGDTQPALVAVRADGRVVGMRRADQFRPDVQMQFGGEGRCGFEMALPATLFDGGRHTILIEEVSSGQALEPPRAVVFPQPQVVATTPALLEELRSLVTRATALLDRFERESYSTAADLGSWDYVFRNFHRTPPATLERQRLVQAGLAYRPRISIVLPSYNTIKWMMIEAIESVLAQTYDNWELIIADDASGDDAVRELARSYQAADGARIHVLTGEDNLGISANTNRALAIATGDYIAFFDHDDLLEPDALFAVVESLQLERFRLVYTDEDSVTAGHLYENPHFKPSWDPILLCGLNYICHFVVVERALLDAAGPLDPDFDGAQDKEFLLRLALQLRDEQVLHIPRVLYHWRTHQGSMSKSEAARPALSKRTQAASLAWGRKLFGQVSATAAEPAGLYGVHLVAGLPTEERPLVSVIIPTRDRAELVADCTLSLLQGSYGNLEILVVDHQSEHKFSNALFRILDTVDSTRVLRYRGDFNWSAINNYAAGRARGEYLLFLNNDTVMITQDAIEQMLAFARLTDAGAVGARLLYGDGRVQHVGVVLGPSGIAGHSFIGRDSEELVYFGYPKLTRSVAAVTGACLLVRRDLFEQVGGFDVGELGVALSDIDLCLKLLMLGRRNIVVSTAEFFHYESASRGSDETPGNRERFAAESAVFQKRWAKLVDADPFYNPNFELRGEPYRRLRVQAPPDYLFRLQARKARQQKKDLLF